MNRPLLSTAALLALAPWASAQFTYSITNEGVSLAVLDGGSGEPITAGDVLTPPGGRPRLPLNGAQGMGLRPLILVGGGVSTTHGLQAVGGL
ncbi:MAG: hypothetical protein AAF368_11505, partial [Planctomycetota bacterium]